jgi:hypothetical protein
MEKIFTDIEVVRYKVLSEIISEKGNAILNLMQENKGLKEQNSKLQELLDKTVKKE